MPRVYKASKFPESEHNFKNRSADSHQFLALTASIFLDAFDRTVDWRAKAFNLLHLFQNIHKISEKSSRLLIPQSKTENSKHEKGLFQVDSKAQNSHRFGRKLDKK